MLGKRSTQINRQEVGHVPYHSVGDVTAVEHGAKLCSGITYLLLRAAFWQRSNVDFFFVRNCFRCTRGGFFHWLANSLGVLLSSSFKCRPAKLFLAQAGNRLRGVLSLLVRNIRKLSTCWLSRTLLGRTASGE